MIHAPHKSDNLLTNLQLSAEIVAVHLSHAKSMLRLKTKKKIAQYDIFTSNPSKKFRCERYEKRKNVRSLALSRSKIMCRDNIDFHVFLRLSHGWGCKSKSNTRIRIRREFLPTAIHDLSLNCRSHKASDLTYKRRFILHMNLHWPQGQLPAFKRMIVTKGVGTSLTLSLRHGAVCENLASEIFERDGKGDAWNLW